MPKGYKHLTYEQRCQIRALLKRKIPKAIIAKDLGIHRSTLSREINRNSGSRGYRHKQAQRESDKRRALASRRSSLKMTPDLIATVRFALENYQWSPDQISGALKSNQIARISAETISQHSGKVIALMDVPGYCKRSIASVARSAVVVCAAPCQAASDLPTGVLAASC